MKIYTDANSVDMIVPPGNLSPEVLIRP